MSDSGFVLTRLEGADLEGAHLESSHFQFAVVDGETLFWGCTMDDATDFTGVGLRSVRARPCFRSRLEGNVRRLMWQSWYYRHPVLRWPVRLFWAFSDYGQSTSRLVGTFALFAVLFGALFCIPGTADGIHCKDGIRVPPWMVPLRALYFSVTTMTTLGPGGIRATLAFRNRRECAKTFAAHLLLMLQVLLGYVLLGALVTRLAILFQQS
jgi:hypothetical protein